jgi:hypothetical protein
MRDAQAAVSAVVDGLRASGLDAARVLLAVKAQLGQCPMLSGADREAVIEHCIARYYESTTRRATQEPSARESRSASGD